jgi:hypothetical protein
VVSSVGAFNDVDFTTVRPVTAIGPDFEEMKLLAILCYTHQEKGE